MTCQGVEGTKAGWETCTRYAKKPHKWWPSTLQTGTSFNLRAVDVLYGEEAEDRQKHRVWESSSASAGEIRMADSRTPGFYPFISSTQAFSDALIREYNLVVLHSVTLAIIKLKANLQAPQFMTNKQVQCQIASGSHTKTVLQEMTN